VPPSDAICLDGERLAAWSAGTLPRAEAASVEDHLADCARCQAMAAAFVRAEAVVPAPSAWWKRWEVRWLVPIATAATVAAIWVALPQLDLASSPAQSQADAETRATAPQVLPPPESMKQAPAPTREVAPAAKPDDLQATRRSALPAAPVRPESREERSADTRAAAASLPPAASASPAASAAPQSVGIAQERLRQSFGTPLEIAARDGMTRWRFGPDGRLERSTDAGTSWGALDLSPPAILTAGHSPGGSVVWLVGRTGAVYVTSDGVRFERLRFAEVIDLVSVVAVDERQATVTAADGRSFATTDRGVSWTPR
jgi:hypothetical protein